MGAGLYRVSGFREGQGASSEYKWQGKAIQSMIYEFILCYMIKGGAKERLS